MSGFDHFEQKRIIRDETMQLREENGEVKLGPLIGEIAKKFIVPVFVIEGILSAVFILFFVFMVHGRGEDDVFLLVVAFAVLGTLLPAAMAGLMFFAWKKTKDQTRFVLSPSRGIVVKNDRDEEIVLPRDSKIEFSYKESFDRDGQPIFDVEMKHGSDVYYILSGRNRDDMQKLCDALQRLSTPNS